MPMATKTQEGTPHTCTRSDSHHLLCHRHVRLLLLMLRYGVSLCPMCRLMHEIIIQLHPVPQSRTLACDSHDLSKTVDNDIVISL